MKYALLLWFAVACYDCCTLTASYKFGDFVETDLVIDSEKVDAYRHQMPRFGVPHRSTTVDSVTKHLGIQFDDGLFVLPVYPIRSKDGNLVRLVVEIYSDETSIQNVVGTPHYSKTTKSPDIPRGIIVAYVWTMQPNGNENTLSVVYTLAVLACFWIILVSSGVMDGKADSSSQSSLTSGGPKWD